MTVAIVHEVSVEACCLRERIYSEHSDHVQQWITLQFCGQPMSLDEFVGAHVRVEVEYGWISSAVS